MKNYLGQTLGLALLVLAMLIGLSLLPGEISLAGLSLRKMDIFSDIRTPASELAAPDTLLTDSTLLALDTLAVSSSLDSTGRDSLGLWPAVDSSSFGQVFEDYTSEQEGLARFFSAVDSIRSYGRTVRVAIFGDSFIEGDILVGDLRDTLQSRWGGDGVGFVPITSEVARFKRTLVHRYEKWNTFSIVKNHGSRAAFGINGFVYTPQHLAFVHYEGADYFKHTRRWTQFRLFYECQNESSFVWQNQDAAPQTERLPAQPDRLGIWAWSQRQAGIRAFALRFEQPDSSLLVYGASLESGPGIYLDNFSVRGNTGGRLRLIEPALVRQFDAYQHYDLVVVQLGTNAVTTKMDNIRWYKAELEQTFAHLRRCFPGKPILLISVADRAGKIDGELITLPSVLAITAMQRELARQYGFLFYDLFHGMGGRGTMLRFASQKPALANKDYTHLTHEGGKVLGHLFAKLFLDAQSAYASSHPAPASR